MTFLHCGRQLESVKTKDDFFQYRPNHLAHLNDLCPHVKPEQMKVTFASHSFLQQTQIQAKSFFGVFRLIFRLQETARIKQKTIGFCSYAEISAENSWIKKNRLKYQQNRLKQFVFFRNKRKSLLFHPFFPLKHTQIRVAFLFFFSCI